MGDCIKWQSLNVIVGWLTSLVTETWKLKTKPIVENSTHTCTMRLTSPGTQLQYLGYIQLKIINTIFCRVWDDSQRRNPISVACHTELLKGASRIVHTASPVYV